jgi:hypothetical protein
MAVQEISKERFDSHNLFRKRSADNALFKEVAWFKDVEADTIGLVVEKSSMGISRPYRSLVRARLVTVLMI